MQQLHSFLLFCFCEEKLQKANVKTSTLWQSMHCSVPSNWEFHGNENGLSCPNTPLNFKRRREQEKHLSIWWKSLVELWNWPFLRRQDATVFIMTIIWLSQTSYKFDGDQPHFSFTVSVSLATLPTTTFISFSSSATMTSQTRYYDVTDDHWLQQGLCYLLKTQHGLKEILCVEWKFKVKIQSSS